MQRIYTSIKGQFFLEPVRLFRLKHLSFKFIGRRVQADLHRFMFEIPLSFVQVSLLFSFLFLLLLFDIFYFLNLFGCSIIKLNLSPDFLESLLRSILNCLLKEPFVFLISIFLLENKITQKPSPVIYIIQNWVFAVA